MPKKKKEKKFKWTDVYGSHNTQFVDPEQVHRWRLNKKKTLAEVKAEDERK